MFEDERRGRAPRQRQEAAEKSFTGNPVYQAQSPESRLYWHHDMCTRCFRLCLFRLRLGGRPAVLTDAVERIKPYVERGVLTVVQDTGPFEELLQKPWSDGVYLIVYRCVKCEEEFQLLTCKGVTRMR